MRRGKELLGSELKAKQFVAVNHSPTCEHPEQWFACTVSSVDPVQHVVRFYSAQYGLVIENRYDQHGVIYDGNGRTVHVFEVLQ